MHETSCLITDVQMPDIGGVELQSRLKADDNSTPIIFITAFSDERIRTRVLAAGAPLYGKAGNLRPSVSACDRGFLCYFLPLYSGPIYGVSFSTPEVFFDSKEDCNIAEETRACRYGRDAAILGIARSVYLFPRTTGTCNPSAAF
jgi:hypothetical protein